MNAVKTTVTENALPVLLGVAAFLAIVGPSALMPTNIAWLATGDPVQHYLGWLFYRNAGWSFPIGLNPDFGLEIGNAITFSDSIPVLAITLKIFSTVLPETFQYFGFWLFLCFVLQAWFAWHLVGLFSEDIITRLSGTVFFVFAPPMIGRLYAHMALGGHFLLLAALYFALCPDLRRRQLAWGGLLVLTALIHAYLLMMVLTIWSVDLVGRRTRSSITRYMAASEVAVILSVLGLVCWQAGYFSVGDGVASGGFGYYRMNLLAPLDANGWSYLLGNIPQGPGDYEGFNYFGLGVLFLAMSLLARAASVREDLVRAIRNHRYLCLALIALALFAISNAIGIGSISIEIPLPEPFLKAANIFRSSGRMFWPVFYAMVLLIIVLTIRHHSKRTATALLCAAAAMQAVDTSASWLGRRDHFMVAPSTSWAGPLVNPFWAQAGFRYEKVRWFLPENQSPHWTVLASFAGAHAMKTDAVYLARISSSALSKARQNASHVLRSGQYDADTLYVLNDMSARQAVLSLPRQHALAKIDGLNVLAPGWNDCETCLPITPQMRLSELLPQVKIGDRIFFSRAGSGRAYLQSGWHQPEAWGTWSSGNSAEIVLPAIPDMQTIHIEANALVAEAHPRQAIGISLGDGPFAEVVLGRYSNNIIDLPVSSEIRDRAAALGYVRIRFQFENAVSPASLRLNRDSRHLALGIKEIAIK